MADTPPRPPAPPAAAAPRWPVWAAAVAAWGAIGLLHATTDYVLGVTGDLPPERIRGAIVVRALEAALWVGATVAVFALVRRFPLGPGRRLRHGAALLAAGVFVVVPLKMAGFHYPGIALGVLDATYPYHRALLALGGQSLVTYLLLVGVAHAVAYARTVRERELARSQLETQLVQAQLQMLKMQLHPHFLFNTLHAVSTLVHADPDRAERMIASLSELLRTTLARQRAQEVTLREELASLEPYLDIEKTRLGERLSVDVRADPRVLDALVPHLLLQPLVENAVRHGISPRSRPGRVEVGAARDGERLRLEVTDNGCGITGAPRPGAIGLANTRARLEQLYGDRHRLQVVTAPEQGTRIAIDLPFRTAAP